MARDGLIRDGLIRDGLARDDLARDGQQEDDQTAGRLAFASLTIAGTLREGARRLAGAGVDSPRLDSRLLLAHALGRTAEDLIRDLTAPAPASDFPALIARRAAREPLAFLLGWREFWSLRFRVSPATLIPRPDSETLVEAALALHPDTAAQPRVLDLGTGTGCLLLAFLRERPNASGIGIDRAVEAARLADRNARDLGLASRAAFLCGDWAEAVDARFDLVLSNPPYIAAPRLGALMRDVAAYEPRAALDGGVCGLTAYRAIIAALPRLLTRQGHAVLELGEGQYDAVAAIGQAAGFRMTARADLAGIARAAILRRDP